MVLSRKDGIFHDAMTKKDWTMEQIMEKQLQIHDDLAQNSGKNHDH